MWKRTTYKVAQAGLYWPTLFKDARAFVKNYDACQRTRNLDRKFEAPLNGILELEVFDLWGIDFMGPFPSSRGKEYILLGVDYVSKWVEAVAIAKADAKTEVEFLRRNVFARYGIPRAIISDNGTHFKNLQFKAICNRLAIYHKIALAHHPQTNGQAEVSNREINQILEKMVKPNRLDWTDRLDEALWAYRIAYKTPIGTSPFRLVYGKPCHLSVELEHRAFWAVKNFNTDMKAAGDKRRLQVLELEEFRREAYENAKLYKEKMKRWHDGKLNS